MKKIIFTAICLLLNAANAFGQIQSEPKYEIHPSLSKKPPYNIYIPKDLEACFKELKTMLTPTFIEEMKSGTEKDMNRYHRGLGMWLRNSWGLWSSSRLKTYFSNLGIYHPDDISSIILVSFWRHLNNKPIALQEQIEYYQKYWDEIKAKAEKNQRRKSLLKTPTTK